MENMPTILRLNVLRRVCYPDPFCDEEQFAANRLRDAFAFAADQYSGHLMRCIAGFGEIAVGAVPARMSGIVAGGASFAGSALSAG